MMYKRHYIRALAQSARVPVAQYMRPDTINETDNRTSPTKMRAILFALALWQLVHHTRSAKSF